MSDEITKEKRSKRIHDDNTAIKKQVRIAKQYNLNLHDNVVKQPHRLVKHHAVNCGNPNCVMCGNPRKFFGEKTIQEQRFEQLKLWND